MKPDSVGAVASRPGAQRPTNHLLGSYIAALQYNRTNSLLRISEWELPRRIVQLLILQVLVEWGWGPTRRAHSTPNTS
jgi:hypothetical protein